MNSLTLYVSSKKVSGKEYGNLTSSEEQTDVYSKDNQRAKTLLEGKLGTYLSIVDLTRCCLSTRIHAMLACIGTTPTLVVDGEKYKGLEKIKEFWNEVLPRTILNQLGVNKWVEVGFRKKIQFGYNINAGEGVVAVPPGNSDWFYVGKDTKNYWIIYLRDMELLKDEGENELWRSI